MDILKVLHDLVFDYTLRTVALGAGTLGIASGALGSFAMLRRQSLLGDAMSHAALPGIVLAFLLTRAKTPLVLMAGAILAGWLATLFMMSLLRTTRLKQDSVLGFILSVFFGFGLMLLTFVQRLPDARQAGLDRFLFGQAATLLERDVITMAALGGVALLAVLAFWKEFKLLSFDPEFGASLGFSMNVLDVILTTLLVIAIVIGLQAVGVVLMSAMVVAPAAAARQWSDRLGVMVVLASAFGMLAGVSGAVLSSTVPHLSTGPTIVLVISAIVLFSFTFATSRGLLWAGLRRLRQRQWLRMEGVLRDLYLLARQHDDPQHPHSQAVLQAMNPGRAGIAHTLNALAQRGLVRREENGEWSLSTEGARQAQERIENESQDTTMEGTS